MAETTSTEPKKKREKRGRKPVPDSNNRHKGRKHIGFTEDETNEVFKKADKLGMDFAVYVRHAAMNFNTKYTKSKGVNDIYSPEINRKTLMELSKIGNNINQIARSINQGRFVFPPEILEELNQTMKILNEISKELNLS